LSEIFIIFFLSRRWYSQREETIQTTKDLVENAFFGAEGFRNGTTLFVFFLF